MQQVASSGNVTELASITRDKDNQRSLPRAQDDKATAIA